MCNMWPDEILNWMQAPVDIDGSYRFWPELNGVIPTDKVEKLTKPTQYRLYVKTTTQEDLMSECLNLQSRQAAEREALRLVEEKATKFRKERIHPCSSWRWCRKLGQHSSWNCKNMRKAVRMCTA